MSLQMGIVGLPNVGKSTLFNALTKAQNAEAANYPFCTIEPNKAVVAVPDARLDHLAQLVDVPNAIHATIEFIDIAGLVAGASKGEGLGNQFLGNIRDVDAILHVVRCFDDDNVVHVSGQPQPAEDIAIINTELALADLEQIERKIEKLERQIKGDRKLLPVMEMAQTVAAFVAEGQPLWAFPQRDDEHFQTLNAEMRFLTAKPVLYVANVDEDSLTSGNAYVEQAQEIADAQNAGLVMVSASLEAELVVLPDDERAAYLELTEIDDSGLERVIAASYRLLGLASYFSFNEQEARAWTIRAGWTAPQAAGVIHTDFEKGFIRAEVVPYSIFAEHGSRSAVKSAGQMQVEGRDYIVKDGDVINFLFNV